MVWFVYDIAIGLAAGLGSSTWNQVQVQVLCHIASTSTGVKNQVQVQVL